MLALILSDIHGNLEALRAALAAAGHYDQLWNLGDNVGYGGSPNDVLDLVRPISTITVRGNHDRVCCGLTSSTQFNPTARTAADWTRAALTGDHLAWLCNLPVGPLAPIPGVLCAHGSPLHEDHYILDLDDAYVPIRRMTAPITFFGHTHAQGAFIHAPEVNREFTPFKPGSATAESATLQLEPTARYLINPGSVGQPRDNDWRAAFATFDTAASLIIFHRIPYDVATAQQRILAAGLPERLAQRLALGI